MPMFSHSGIQRMFVYSLIPSSEAPRDTTIDCERKESTLVPLNFLALTLFSNKIVNSLYVRAFVYSKLLAEFAQGTAVTLYLR